MRFKVFRFCVPQLAHKPDKKHGIDNDEYLGAYKTPFKYQYKPKPNIDKNRDNKKVNYAKKNINIGGGYVGY